MPAGGGRPPTGLCTRWGREMVLEPPSSAPGLDALLSRAASLLPIQSFSRSTTPWGPHALAVALSLLPAFPGFHRCFPEPPSCLVWPLPEQLCPPALPAQLSPEALRWPENGPHSQPWDDVS